MQGHKSKGVNRYVRDFIGKRCHLVRDTELSYCRRSSTFTASKPERAAINWKRRAVIALESHQAWPGPIDAIVEPVCIALGAFTTGAHFNVSYFDHGSWSALASTVDVVNGWMAIVRESYTIREDGTIQALPTSSHKDV